MTTAGIILWILVLVAVVFGLLKKRREDQAGGDTHEGHEGTHRQHKGGCCG